MASRIGVVLLLTAACAIAYLASQAADACCPAPPRGKPVVNADQTVIIIWDAAAKMQHFIRQASFKSDADDFGFIVPSPTQPSVEESGNDAFPHLLKLTEPEVIVKKRSAGEGGGGGCIGCAAKSGRFMADQAAAPKSVKVLEEKQVGDFHAAILEAKSASALVDWLKENGYATSPEIEAWAKPYVEQEWKFTALKVAKDKKNLEAKKVSASALRISFKTDRPVFPYREPDYKSAADALQANRRLLRIYFLAEARYKGELTKESPWTGNVAWAGAITAEQRKKLLEQMKLPETTGPAEWWLTEFEDNWPYKVAPADVYFSKDANQAALKREPIVRFVAAPYPTDASPYALAAALIFPAVWLRLRRRWR